MHSSLLGVKVISGTLVLGALALTASTSIAAPVKNARSRAQLEDIFQSPRDSVRTACYWYWINGQVTPEGVAEDIRAMKRAGITRAFIGNQGFDDMPNLNASVKIQSPEWYEVVRSAMKTASEEGVELGMFNCPGWSQAGGPWNAPEQSMRFLGTQVQEVKGNGSPVKVSFPTPKKYIATEKVLAYPSRHFRTVSSSNADITAQGISDAAMAFDADTATHAIALADKGKISIKSRDGKPFTLRSLRVDPGTIILTDMTLLARNAEGQMQPVGTYHTDRTCMENGVGYDKLALAAFSLPNVTSDEFEIDITTINPGCHLRDITLSEEPVVDDYTRQMLSKLHQTPQPAWTDYKWTSPVAYTEADGMVQPDEVIDVTESFADGVLTYAFPEGDWTVMRTYSAPTGLYNSPTRATDGRGPEVDRWSHDALNHHYDSYIGEVLRHIPAEERTTFTTIVSDSYETGIQNWGDDYVEYFKEHYGYDPTPFLMTYAGTVVGDAEQSNRFLWDFRRMVADRLSADHIKAMSDRAHKDGLKVWLESYGHWGFPGEFLQYGGASDEVAGEFWSEGSLGDIENRAASSASHIYGKGKTWSESFTCGGMEYTRSPRNMKQRGDKFFTEGINGSLLHLVISQIDNDQMPGINAWFSNEFNRKNTWYSQLDQFTDYLKRANFLLTEGNYVADVAYYIGEDAPVMYGITEPAMPEGYQFDFINADVIRDNLRADADHVLSLPHGTQYRLLVLPPSKAMRPSVLKAIKRLLDDGAVVLATQRPDHSPSLQDYPKADEEVKELAQQIWGNLEGRGVRNVGKGLLFNGYEIPEVFQTLSVIPDFQAKGSDNILYAHTTAPGREIYFVSNQAQEPQIFDASFRTIGRAPEFWNAIDGSRRAVKSYATAGNTTLIPMRLDANESMFVIFEQPVAAEAHDYDVELNFPTPQEVLTLEGPWTIELTDMFGAKKTLKNAPLQDLSKSADRDVKYFSGTARYTKNFNLKDVPEGENVLLDLGKMGEMARVKINGVEVGGAWTAPYTVKIGDALKKGKNTVEIEVVNNWHNRLVGDDGLTPGERKTTTIVDTYNAESPLQETGLMGPVRIMK